MRFLTAALLLVFPLTAFGFSATITFSPAVASPGQQVTATISGLAKGPLLPPAVTISGSTITIDATTNGAICGPACGYNIQATFTAPAQTGTYDVDYWITFAGERTLTATTKIAVANVCDFGHSLTAAPSGVSIGNGVELTWCSPGFSLTDSGYAVHSYRIYMSHAADGPFTPIGDPQNGGATSAFVAPLHTGTTYYYVESHGCLGAFVLCGAGAPDTTMNSNIVAVSATLPGGCLRNATTLCLASGRFAVTAQWQTPDGRHGDGQAVPQTNDSGYFWFFDKGNVEVTTKVLNACSLTPSAFWVFAAGMTNVQVDLTVTDTQSKTVKHYTNPLGTMFTPIVDTTAFFCP